MSLLNHHANNISSEINFFRASKTYLSLSLSIHISVTGENNFWQFKILYFYYLKTNAISTLYQVKMRTLPFFLFLPQEIAKDVALANISSGK